MLSGIGTECLHSVESRHSLVQGHLMPQQPVRLRMLVSEPWEFVTGPVNMDVLSTLSEKRWSVSLVDGWPNAADVAEAVLETRYVGETLGPLLRGEEVIVSLGVRSTNGFQGVLGAVRLVP